MGALITAEGLCAIVFAMIVVLCWQCCKYNRRRSGKREFSEFSVSTNKSYDNVLFSAEGEELYVNDKLYEQLPCHNGEMPSPKESPVIKPEPPVRAKAETTGGRRQT